MAIPNEYVTVRARVERGRDGRASLALDERRCAGCVTCFGRASRSLALAELSETVQIPLGASVDCRWPVGAVTLAALTLYGLPLVAILAGATLGALVAGPDDLAAVVGALVGLVAGGLTTRGARRRVELALSRRLEVCGVADADAL